MLDLRPRSALLAAGVLAAVQDVEPLPLDDARDVTGEGLAFVELVAERTELYVHQPVRVRLRLGLEREFWASQVIQPFRRILDIPVQVREREEAGEDDLAIRTIPPGPDRRPATLALDGDVVAAAWAADEVRDGRRYAVAEIERVLRAGRPGELRLAGPLLSFAFATGFAEDLLRGRVPLDRSDAVVRGESLVLRIQPLPEEGRPPEFTGVVGRFSVAASARPRELAAGESLELELAFAGEDGLDRLALSWLAVDGFHVEGMIAAGDRRRRTITCGLSPRSEAVHAVPALSFAYFDPEPPAGYRAVRTSPIPIAVRPPPPPVRDDLLARRRGWRAPILGGAGVLAAGLVALLVLRGRRRRARAASPGRRSDAAAAFRGRIAAADAELVTALVEYLAARLDCPPPAIFGRDLAARLAIARVPGVLAARTTAILAGLVGARYGGGASAAGVAEVAALVADLEAAFRAAAAAR
ncbi:MAG: hypothetical protein AB1726_03795 [Planctomycetota bacterium]